MFGNDTVSAQGIIDIKKYDFRGGCFIVHNGFGSPIYGKYGDLIIFVDSKNIN